MWRQTGSRGLERQRQPRRLRASPCHPRRYYLLLQGGGGFTCFDGCKNVTSDTIKDADALQNYLAEVCGGEIPAAYENRYGEGRITIVGE